jgi:hypothetical protein
MLLTLVLTAAESTPAPCCKCEDAKLSNGAICLGAREMRDRVDHLEPLKPTGLDRGLNLAGVVVLEIRFESSGAVECARAKSGNPIAVSAAMEAVRKWTFRPILLEGKPKSGCGLVTIKYRLRRGGSSTELQ